MLHTPHSLAAAALSQTHIKTKLRQAGLRPTRQRTQLCHLLLHKGHRHVTAEMLYIEAKEAKVLLSLATVYNTLSQFCDVGLLRQLPVGHSSTVYDTNVTSHQHFVMGQNGPVIDIDDHDIQLGALPKPPEGYRIAGVDVVIRLEKDGDPQPACAAISVDGSINES